MVYKISSKSEDSFSHYRTEIRVMDRRIMDGWMDRWTDNVKTENTPILDLQAK